MGADSVEAADTCPQSSRPEIAAGAYPTSTDDSSLCPLASLMSLLFSITTYRVNQLLLMLSTTSLTVLILRACKTIWFNWSMGTGNAGIPTDTMVAVVVAAVAVAVTETAVAETAV